MERIRSDFLFATHSVLAGFARLLDLGGTFDEYNRSRTARDADARALHADWAITGYDLIDAASQDDDDGRAAAARQHEMFDDAASR